MCRGNALSCSSGVLLCILQFTVVLLQQTCAANHQQRCSPSSCGIITNISYPFRLRGDPANCGDPRYELACENDMTVLPLFSGKYHVKAINYHNYTIRLVDPAIQEADCSSTPRYFLSSSNFTDSYNYSYDGSDPYQATQKRIYDDTKFKFPAHFKATIFQHVIYMNCSNPVRDDPRYVDTAPCVNWHSKGHVYALAGDLLVRNLKADCHVELVAATSFGLKIAYEEPLQYNQTFSFAEIHRMLAYGFDVSWLNRACEGYCDPNSCWFNQISENYQCHSDFCITPLGFETRCGNMSMLRIFAEDYVYGILKGLRQIVREDSGEHFEVNISKAGLEMGVITGRKEWQERG